jgi:tRNA (guanine-N(7)-)-methyltransferase subunit TRM82
MKVPFQGLLVSGQIIFAAQGDSIHAFDQEFNFLSTWRHSGRQGAEKPGVRQENGSEEPVTEGQDSPAGEGPPTKRRKVEGEDQDVEAGDDNVGDEDEDQAADANPDQPESGPKKSRRRKKQKGIPPSRQSHYSTPSERPFVMSLNATSVGRHVIAVTSSDKAIRVFEHDGQGHLQQLSHR